MSLKEYRVVIYKEGSLANILLEAANVDSYKFTNFLNEYAAEGWTVRAIEREIRRTFLFFQQEGFIVILERDRNPIYSQQPAGTSPWVS